MRFINIRVRGDLQFSLGRYKIWDLVAITNNISKYFVWKMKELGIYDIEPINKNLTWHNIRFGDRRITKLLDRILVSYYFIEDLIRIRHWIGLGGDF
jgi:hypothetical protein